MIVGRSYLQNRNININVGVYIMKTNKIRVRDLLRAEFLKGVESGILGKEGEGTTQFRKGLLAFVVANGGAKNSGPAEYNTVMAEMISAGVITKIARGRLVANASAVVVPAGGPVAEPVAEAQSIGEGQWLVCNRETGAVEARAVSKNKAYSIKTPEQVVRKAEEAVA